MKYIATVEVTKEEWEAIQASLSVDLREYEDGYDEEIINKYDFRAGTNPATFYFVFENGERIICDWYIEEFGGAINWFDETLLDTIDGDTFELKEETVFNAPFDDEYICRFKIIEK